MECRHGYPEDWCEICRAEKKIQSFLSSKLHFHNPDMGKYFDSVVGDQDEMWVDDLIRKGGFNAN